MTNPNDDGDLEAIQDIMEAYDVDEETAREMWERFKDTVKKMSQIGK
jgi:hypothetical protein